MKDVKMKELLMQWKNTLVCTGEFLWKWIVIISKFIWKKIVIFSKWLWGEFREFANGATWITVVILGMLCFSIFLLVIVQDARKMEMSAYTEQIDSLQYVIDSLKVDEQINFLMLKAGEYAITPHHETNKITKDSAASLLVDLGAWYPDIILAQLQVESGFGESDVAVNSNNMLGMRKTNSRKTTQIKNTDYKGYGKYTNWESCLIDRVMWDYEIFGAKQPSRETYVEKLNARYGEAEGYGYSMDRYSKKYRKYL